MGDISPNFSRWECACKCGCGRNDVDLRLMPILEAVRTFKGRGFSPTSVCRCVPHNEEIQRAVNPAYIPMSSKSRHLLGTAADIPHDKPYSLYNYLNRVFPDVYGIGVYSWGVHVDTRILKARWGGRIT